MNDQPDSPKLHQLLILLTLLWLPLALAACSASVETATGPEPVVAPAAPLADASASRAVSALEALSRGVAAVTPPGAALQDVYYQFDSIDLASDAEEILRQNAEWMKANPDVQVEVEGHCDDIGSADYNLALGAKRAQAARDFLVTHGVASERLVTISYGKEAPACFERTEECRVKNRRARFVIFTELPQS